MTQKTTLGPRKLRTADNNYLSLFKTFKTYKNEFNLTEQQFNIIIKSFFFILLREMIQKAKTFALPNKLGVFGIRKTPTHGRGYFDYQLYRNTGIKRYLRNNHSEQLVARIYWNQAYNRMRDKLVCIFKLAPSRKFTRGLSQYIKNNNSISQYYDK